MSPVTATLSQHHRVGQCGRASRDMHGSTTGEVQATHLDGPSIGVPGPAGDGIIDDGGPDEHEDDAGQHTTALGNGTGSKGHGDGGEHALVEAEEQIGDTVGADRRAGENITKSDVGQIADKGTGGV